MDKQVKRKSGNNYNWQPTNAITLTNIHIHMYAGNILEIVIRNICNRKTNTKDLFCCLFERVSV